MSYFSPWLYEAGISIVLTLYMGRLRHALLISLAHVTSLEEVQGGDLAPGLVIQIWALNQHQGCTVSSSDHLIPDSSQPLSFLQKDPALGSDKPLLSACCMPGSASGTGDGGHRTGKNLSWGELTLPVSLGTWRWWVHAGPSRFLWPNTFEGMLLLLAHALNFLSGMGILA